MSKYGIIMEDDDGGCGFLMHQYSLSFLQKVTSSTIAGFSALCSWLTGYTYSINQSPLSCAAGEPKLKLYRDGNGEVKGDGLCCYLKVCEIETTTQ